MELKTLDSLLAEPVQGGKKPVMAVAGSAEAHVLEAVLAAVDAGVAGAVLCGSVSRTGELLRALGRDPGAFDLREAPAGWTDAELAVDCIKAGEADFLVKGLIETSDLLRPVVKKENGLRTGRTMSHLAFNSLPSYHKVIVNTDGGMCTYPDLSTKADILMNAVTALRTLGYAQPKVACLCCKETVDAKMPETLEARALREMAEAGRFGDCFVEGPISYDIAMNREIAALKGFDRPCCGDFDILLVPNIHAGNILGKSWLVSAGATLAGVVVGARIPIVLTSRGSSAREKLLSIALAGRLSADGTAS